VTGVHGATPVTVTVMVILIAVGELVLLFMLLDLADYLLARAGKKTVLHGRARQDWYFQAHHAQGAGRGNLFDRRPADGGAQTSIYMQNGP
jgi:hypothetical protein